MVGKAVVQILEKVLLMATITMFSIINKISIYQHVHYAIVNQIPCA